MLCFREVSSTQPPLSKQFYLQMNIHSRIGIEWCWRHSERSAKTIIILKEVFAFLQTALYTGF